MKDSHRLTSCCLRCLDFGKNVLARFRVKDWIHYLGYVVLGSLIANNFDIRLYVISSLLLAYAFALNDYYDENRSSKQFLIPLLLLLPLFITLNLLQLLVCFLFLLIFTAYSLPLFYLEGRPVLSSLSNGFGFLLLFLLPLPSIGSILQAKYLLVLLFLLNMSAQFIHEVVDYEEDKEAGKRTTTVSYGIPTSKQFLLILLVSIIAASIVLLYTYPLFSLTLIAYTSYFLILSFRSSIDRAFRKRFKQLGLVCGLILALELILL